MMYPANDHYVLDSDGSTVLSLPASLFASREAAEQAFYEIEKALDSRMAELESRLEEALEDAEEAASRKVDIDSLPLSVDVCARARMEQDSPGTIVIREPVTRAKVAEIPLGCSSRRLLECIVVLVEWALERAFSEYCGDVLDEPKTSFSFEG